MNSSEQNYNAVITLYKKLPTQLIRYIVSFGILSKSQILKKISDRLRAYKIKGDKAKFGRYIRVAFDGQMWRKYGLTYLVKQQPAYQGDINTHFNQIQDIIDRIIDANQEDFIPVLETIEKYLLENKFIK
jgi:hypothetical protein